MKKTRIRQPMKESTKQKIKEAMLRIGHKPPSQKGLKRSKESCEKISKAKTGFRHTLETRHRMSISRKGENNWNYGKKTTKVAKERMSLAKIGKRPPNFIKDRMIANKKRLLRATPEWRKWRKAVFERDNYTCQECKERGCYIEPHHIVPVREGNTERLFNLENGITLCRPCHQKTIWKESDYVVKYNNIIKAQV